MAELPAAALLLPPAPPLGGAEATAEMAELYALALVRDVPFSALDEPTTVVRLDDEAAFSIADLVAELTALPWFGAASDADGHDRAAARRRATRFAAGGGPLAIRDFLRGSTIGSRVGPHVSQFLLAVGGDQPAAAAA